MGHIHLEPLSKGLWTARDPAFLPEGGLQQAKNARYQPGDVAIYQAEGRELFATGADPGYLANLVWDPGSQAVQGKPEPYQLLYVDVSETAEPRRVGTLELTPNTVGNFRASTIGADLPSYIDQGPLEAVGIVDRANADLLNWILFSGGSPRDERNLVLVRGARATSELRKFQMSRATTPLVWYTGSVDRLIWEPLASAIFTFNTEQIHFGFEFSWEGLDFAGMQHRGNPPANDLVWEYWNTTTQAWATLTVSDGTNQMRNAQGPVSWTPPATWGKATFQKVTGRVLPTTNTLLTAWGGTTEWFWIRLRVLTDGFPLFWPTRPFGRSTLVDITRLDQRVLGHGLPESDSAGISATAAVTIAPGLTINTRYWYWWVWADETNNHEGTAGDTANVFLATSTSLSVTLVINWGTVARPANATHIHIYRGSSVDGSDGSIDSAYPSGIRIFRAAVSAITPNTSYSFTDRGDGMSSNLPSPWDTVQFTSVLGEEFPQAALRDPVTGELIGVPRNGAPPSASTGDVFQECLVTNDLSDPRKIRFSYPGHPHSFPSLNYVNLETRDADRVVAIKTVGSVVGIATTRGIWRLNWLPRDSDVDFSRGDMLTQVVADFGASNAAAVTRFSPPGSPIMLAWAGASGLYASDLYDWRELIPQFDWKAVGVGQKQLVNNPLQSRLELYVPEKNSCWYIHYHPSLLQDGIYPVTGPMERPGGIGAAAFMQTSDTTGTVVSSAGVSLLFEGRGEVDGANGTALAAQITTREMYLAGMGNEFKVERALLHTKASWLSNPILLGVSSGVSKPSTLSIIRTGNRRLEAPWALGKTEYVQLDLGARVDEDFGLAVTVVGVEVDSLGRREAR